jgi:hypothetical protein
MSVETCFIWNYLSKEFPTMQHQKNFPLFYTFEPPLFFNLQNSSFTSFTNLKTYQNAKTSETLYFQTLFIYDE